MKSSWSQEFAVLKSRVRDFVSARAGVYSRSSYSQEGEDLILDRLFEDRPLGFYVDVGAHHPTRFSNTCLFYKRGWQGINIEPNPDALALFKRYRKRDINLGYGVADQRGDLAYYMFNEPALNTFDPEIAKKRPMRYRLIETMQIPVRRLAEILEESLPTATVVDFMSIDVEGLDLEVLKSNDWQRFRPACLLVEAIGFKMADPNAESVHAFLQQRNYELFAKTFNTVFYVDTVQRQAGTLHGASTTSELTRANT